MNLLTVLSYRGAMNFLNTREICVYVEKMGLLFWIHTDPRRFIGEISARYIGANPAFSPQLMPMINRPTIIISYDSYIFETPKKKFV